MSIVNRLVVWVSPVYLSVAICILNNSQEATNLERLILYASGYLLGWRYMTLINKGKVVVGRYKICLLLGFLCLIVAISSFFM